MVDYGWVMFLVNLLKGHWDFFDFQTDLNREVDTTFVKKDDQMVRIQLVTWSFELYTVYSNFV